MNNTPVLAAVRICLFLFNRNWMPKPVLRFVSRQLVSFAYWWKGKGNRLYNLWMHRVTRVTLALTPCPVTIHYTLFCCDTGYFHTEYTYRWGWPAFKRTTWEELYAGSDGPAGYWAERHWFDGEFKLGHYQIWHPTRHDLFQ